MEIIHSGFDKLEISFTGCLNMDLRQKLREGKETAIACGYPVPVDLGGVIVWVKDKGAEGGYPFVFDTPQGDMWAVKDNGDYNEWNLRCVVSAMSCATDGFKEIQFRLESMLNNWCGIWVSRGQVGVSRIDFAVDFIEPRFSIKPELMVCHSRISQGAHTSLKEDDSFEEFYSFKNREINSYRIGKMPNKQIAIYDKTREVRSVGKDEWFRIWDIEKDDRDTVWRIEVRAGKDALKKAGIRSFEEIEKHLGSLYFDIMDSIRMLDMPLEESENVSRADVSEIWQKVQKAVYSCLDTIPAPCDYNQVKEVTRERMKRIYEKMIVGCAAGYIVAKDMPKMNGILGIHKQISSDIRKAIVSDPAEFTGKINKAIARLKFIEPVYNQGKGALLPAPS